MRPSVILSLLCHFNAVLGVYMSIVLKSPADGALYPSINESSVTVQLNYDLTTDDDAERKAFCFHLTNLDEQMRYSESCFKVKTREIAINEVSVGNYVLTSFMRELDPSTQQALAVVAQSEQTRKFAVKEYEKIIPLLYVNVDQCEEAGGAAKAAFPVDPKTKTAVAELSFRLQARQLSFELFRVCLALVAPEGAVIVKEMCLQHGELSARVSNLPIGTYHLQAGLRGTEDGGTIPSSRSITIVEVYDLRGAVTSLHISEHAGLVETPESGLQMEYVLDSHSLVASAPFTVHMETSPCSAERFISVCLELRTSLDVENIILPRTCLASSARTFIPQALPSGSFIAFLSLHDGRLPPVDADGVLSARHQIDPSHALRVLIETRAQQELVPTYDWQRLHAWHTIPAGMDVR